MPLCVCFDLNFFHLITFLLYFFNGFSQVFFFLFTTNETFLGQTTKEGGRQKEKCANRWSYREKRIKRRARRKKSDQFQYSVQRLVSGNFSIVSFFYNCECFFSLTHTNSCCNSYSICLLLCLESRNFAASVFHLLLLYSLLFLSLFCSFFTSFFVVCSLLII